MAANIGDTVEAEGINTREAISAALKKLGVPKKRVNVQVLSEERKGLFGMEGAEPARVRVTVIR